MDRDRENPPEPMDEGTKRRCDVLQALWENAWKRIVDRRTTEWHVSISLWTALAGFVVLTLQYKIRPAATGGWGVDLAVAVITCAVPLLHAWCLNGMLRRYRIDRDMAANYENELMRLSGLTLPDELRAEREKLLAKRRTMPKPRLFLRELGWWVQSQLLVTALLCSVAALALAGVIRAGK